MTHRCLLVFTTALMLCQAASAQKAPAGGPKDPKEAGGGGGEDSAASQVNPQALLASPDAKVAASYRCATTDATRQLDLKTALADAQQELNNQRTTVQNLEELARKTPGAQADDQVRLAREAMTEHEVAVKEMDAAVKNFKAPPECPLTADVAAELSRRFRQPLQNANGSPTALVSSLTKLLQSTYDEERVAAANAKYILIHLVDLLGGTGVAQSHTTNQPAAKAGSEAAATLAGRWILARRDGTSFTYSETDRIYGARTIGLVFVHLNALIGATQPAEARYGDIHYRAIVEPKLAENLRRLLSAFQLAGAFQSKRAERTIAYMGWGVMTDTPVPSDVTVFGVAPSGSAQPKMVGTPKKYDNEGKYIWDFSVAVPVNKISLVEYSEANGTFFPKQINKQSVYGAFNIYPWPVDIKAGNLRYILPRAVAGVGLTGRPGENFLVGGSWGFRELQFFLGSGFANTRTLRPGMNPADPVSYEQKYASRLTYGLNIPIAAAIKKVSESAKSKK